MSLAPRIVLVRPAEPMNVGAVARAMKNCELADLVLVSPRTDDWVTARRVAVHAEELLEDPRIVSSLAEAVADCAWVVGTTSRFLPGRPPIAPRQVGERSRKIAGRVALVFGGEESGLSNDDLVRCHDVSTIPSGREQPSFNLAQAVMIYGYECGPARSSIEGSHQEDLEDLPRVADRELQQLEHAMRELLRDSGFVDLDRPRHGVLELLQPLRRAGLTPEEAKLWHAALRAALKRGGKGG